MKRKATTLIIARQIAISNGHVWNNLQPRQINIYMTLAENILASVERSMVRYSWDFDFRQYQFEGVGQAQRQAQRNMTSCPKCGYTGGDDFRGVCPMCGSDNRADLKT